MAEITDYPNVTVPCDYCDGEAHKVEEKRDNYTQTGYECDDCGRILPA